MKRKIFAILAVCSMSMAMGISTMAATVIDKVTSNLDAANETSRIEITVIPDNQYEIIIPDIGTCYFPPTDHKDKPDNNNEWGYIQDPFDYEITNSILKFIELYKPINLNNQNYDNNN